MKMRMLDRICLHSSKIGQRNFLTVFSRNFHQSSASNTSFKAADVEIIHPKIRKTVPDLSKDVPFGKYFAEHMVTIDWAKDKGWGKPRIEAFEDFRISPSAKVLHYGVSCFEGMKAYRGVDKKIRLFRPELNVQRLRKSGARASLPDFDPKQLNQLITQLISIDKAWVPPNSDSSLYIRPTFMATDPSLGLAAPEQAKLFVISSPSGNYLNKQSITLLADGTHCRAFPGGAGAHKLASNYGPTIEVAAKAQNDFGCDQIFFNCGWKAYHDIRVATNNTLGRVKHDMQNRGAVKLAAIYKQTIAVQKYAKEKHGCDQVLWLSGKDEEVTEAGAMNVFITWENKKGELELVTPPLDTGLILPGITRQSLIELASEDKKVKVSERKVTMSDVAESLKDGRLHEIFCVGTAAVVSAVGEIVYGKGGKFEKLAIPTLASKHKVMHSLREKIVGIQTGAVVKEGWTKVIE